MASSSMLYDMTMCAACGKKDAHSRCTRCLQAAYCDEKCQGVHWRAGHKRECKKKTDPDASTPGAVTSAGTADTASHQRAGDDLALTVSTAAATATSTHHECGPCKKQLAAAGGGKCPACRASIDVSDGEKFRRLHELVHTRSPGRHTPVAQFNLGVMYQIGPGVAQDFKEAARLYTLAAAQGHAKAQSNLGFMYDNGTGVPQDDNEAVRLYTLAAAQGHVDAQLNLGSMYKHGTGVAQDDKETARLYALAAAQGQAHAQYELGGMQAIGKGVAQDFKEAVRLSTLAATQGHAGAQHFLGSMYRTGRGVAKDNTEAARLYTLSATQGDARAQCTLGSMYGMGQGGLVRDLAEAATWLQLAAAQGQVQAQSLLDYIATAPMGAPGMRVQVIGLTSADGLAINGQEGLVQDKATKPGRASVLLDGDTTPTSISTTNLRKAGGLQ